MKQRKNISKIALLAGLLMLNTTANSFYQCVPKKKWRVIIYLTYNSHPNEFKQTLEAGRYRVTAAGAGGTEKIQEFTLSTTQQFKACVGKRGYPLGDGGGGIGYEGYYIGGRAGSRSKKTKSKDGEGYGNSGLPGKGITDTFGFPTGGYGCYGGGGGFSDLRKKTLGMGIEGSLGGAGGGSYFEIDNATGFYNSLPVPKFIQLTLRGGDGQFMGRSAAPDGYVKIEEYF